MPETIRVAEYLPPQETKHGKWTPHKLRDGNGRVFVFGKQEAELVKSRQGQDLEITYLAKNNYDEYPLTSAAIPAPPAAKPATNGGYRSRDPEETSLILRQVALKCAVEFCRGKDWATTDGVVIEYAEIFNDWLHGKVVETVPVAEQRTPSPEQWAAQKALRTGGRYDAALAEGESLADATRRVLADHDPMDDLSRIPPADEAELRPQARVARERMAPSGAPRR